jgi:hypothetical protein|nr:MAG TPA: Putative transferase, nesg, ydcK, Structural Genomics.38A [Caudoviricetes sp.]
MIKKYEIIMDGSKKRIKALRSFHVQGRYVNIGDVGGIVYDENTLSQEGNGWIFSGNLNYPTIRVSGDSIVDTNGYEADVTDPRPFVNITGTSALIGAHDFVTGSTADGEPIEAYIDINDSRVEFQYTGAMTVATKVNPGNATSGVLKSVIDTSNVIISKTGGGEFVANIFADVVKCGVEWKLISARGALVGNFTKVDRLLLDGTIAHASTNSVKSLTTVRDCRTFALSTSVFPLNTANDAIGARMPFVFTRCNVEHGLFYHNPVNRNTYTDIDFEKALTDLAKPLANADLILVSGERNGMYRVASKSTRVLGPLVEDIRSVKNLKLTAVGPNTQGVEIYGDAYLVGAFTIEGNQVYGGSLGHGRSNDIKAKHRVVQGTPNALTVGSTVTGIAPSKSAVVTPIRYRINSESGISLKNIPEGIQAQIVVVNERNVIEGVSGAITTSGNFSSYAKFLHAFINFSKTDYTPITPDELGDTTITVYNGCKIVNTGATAVNMKGNIRVEDNASVYNSTIDGSGYFGGNSVTENANVRGCMYIKDNAVFAPVAEENKSDNLIHLEGNARFIATSRAGLNAIKMSGNSVFSGVKANSTIDIDLRDNAEVIGSVSGSGTLVMEDNARVEAGTLTVAGEVTLCGLYKQTAARNFIGKRIVSSEQEPGYDDNVKTEYDF